MLALPHVSPRPPTFAALAKTRLSAGLGRAFDRGRDGPGGWWIFHEPELHFGEDVLVPDVTGWRRERMPKLPDTDYVILAPDWACEVLSPATRRLDLVDKRPVYAREGVPHLWLVDPTDRTLEAFELRDGEWVLIASAKDDEPISIRPFDAITFSLADPVPVTASAPRRASVQTVSSYWRKHSRTFMASLLFIHQRCCFLTKYPSRS